MHSSKVARNGGKKWNMKRKTTEWCTNRREKTRRVLNMKRKEDQACQTLSGAETMGVSEINRGVENV